MSIEQLPKIHLPQYTHPSEAQFYPLLNSFDFGSWRLSEFRMSPQVRFSGINCSFKMYIV